MELQLALVTGVLFSSAIYLMLRRNMVRLVFGLVLLGHANNLLILGSSHPARGNPPIIGEEENTLSLPYADPLPQALILTAIVIGFAVQAFALVLVRRAYGSVGSDDLDVLSSTDRIDEPTPPVRTPADS